MIDRDAYITAATLLKEHGELAWLHATTKAETLLEEGDIKGQRVWLKIIRAIDDLQRQNSGSLH